VINIFKDRGALLIKLPYLIYLFLIFIIFTSTLFFLFLINSSDKLDIISYLKSIRFSFFQALLASFISSIFGFIFGLFFYLSNKNQKMISSFLNFCFILPVIFISFGFIFFYNSRGPISILFEILSLQYEFKIFSLIGIIYVTSYFNIAFNANFFFRKMVNIPENYIKILQSNGVPFLYAIRLQLKKFIFSGYSSVIILTFVFCIGNFTIVYLLSGSPNLTTIELAIYQSIVFEANLKKAIILGLTQLCIILLGSVFIVSKSLNFSSYSNFRLSHAFKSKNIFLDIIFWIIIIYFCLPFLVFIKGLLSINFEIIFSISFIKSLINSLSVSFISLSISILLSLSALSIYRYFVDTKNLLQKFVFVSITILLFIPSLSLSAIIFYFNYSLNFIFNNFFIVSLINSFFITPLMFIFLSSKFMENNIYDYKNSIFFNILPTIRLIKIDLPKIKKELYLISSTVFVLSLGDLTSVTIFNDSTFKTIPLYISQLYSNYRYEDAFFVLSLFIIIILLIMYIPFILKSKND
tara:strand:+ start:3218 stop:4786 length:1569 start_codon:yes stop_codon:yes gene_type:complete